MMMAKFHLKNTKTQLLDHFNMQESNLNDIYIYKYNYINKFKIPLLKIL
ncbi:unnamed protein product (macronuclear) [Paramecium tetraurelia]|uniref:Uncharacterized protein n=1 Tax=Paramecium tetraurelia TaxID=5888 RepID=A0E1D0_PARTE|nr:uncharacterized protein GSPATT00022266001 [Paramecium tetraurelia]CAK89097.1 unnamed protein product [Paramecium tetraurelia]|eukprot:XP_001456494.1 hypothetical protein (macronuclear) [Paramecium tetraurelia strain d4-2]